MSKLTITLALFALFSVGFTALGNAEQYAQPAR